MKILRALLLAALLLPLACASGGGGGGESGGGEDGGFLGAFRPSISEEQERVVGAQADAQIRSQLLAKDLLIDDPVVTAWLDSLGQSIARRIEPRIFQYHFRLIREDSLNAFALPGGYIYFHSGTLLEANSLDELAGVMAHEIAHAKRHHWAHSVRENALPQLIASFVGLGLTAATGEAAPLVIAQGVSESLRIAYTRELEGEADRVGSALMVRAGYDPEGMAAFFRRLVAKRGRPGSKIPPYLFTHPRPEQRAEEASERARGTTISGAEDAKVRAEFRDVQARLGLLVARRRSTLPPDLPAPNRALVSAAVREAVALQREGKLAAALETLRAAEAREPFEPRLPFLQAEWLEEAGQLQAAADAYQRAMKLDPLRPLVHFRLGRVHRALKNFDRAIFYYEKAEHRFAKAGPLSKETERVLMRLNFPTVHDSGFEADLEAAVAAAQGEGAAADAATPNGVGGGAAVYAADAEALFFWARIDLAFQKRRKEFEVRWLDPAGRVVHKQETRPLKNTLAFAVWEPEQKLRPGIWQLEIWLDDEYASAATFRVTPAKG